MFDFNQIRSLLTDFRRSSQYQISRKSFSGSRTDAMDRQTDGHES